MFTSPFGCVSPTAEKEEEAFWKIESEATAVEEEEEKVRAEQRTPDKESFCTIVKVTVYIFVRVRKKYQTIQQLFPVSD